jgi:hypothetical protein
MRNPRTAATPIIATLLGDTYLKFEKETRIKVSQPYHSQAYLNWCDNPFKALILNGRYRTLHLK